jgi:hypothetical protein
MADIIGFMHQPLTIGMRVTLALHDGNCPLPVGSAGRIIRVVESSGGRVLVEWDDEDISLHGGGGHCRAHHGFNISPFCLAPESFSPYDYMLDRFRNEMDSHGQYLIIHGNVFELNELNIHTATDILRQRDTQMAETFRNSLESVRQLECGLRERYARKLLFPPILAGHIARGIVAYRIGNEMHICMPFQYAPQFITSDGETFAIPGALKREIARTDLIIDVTIPDFSTVLRVQSTMRVFNHYHSMGTNDCIGTLDISPYVTGDDSSLMSRIERLAARIQELFVTINMADAALKEPDGLPTVYAIWEESSEEAQNTGVLSSDEDKDEPAPSSVSPTRQQFPIGCSVFIRGASDCEAGGFDENAVAIVRHCYLEEENLGDPFYAVEFMTEHANRHECDEHTAPNRGWFVRESCLRLNNTISTTSDFLDGDPVIVVSDREPSRIGLIGRVCGEANDHSICVIFPESIPGGHDCGGRTSGERGRWFEYTDIRHVGSQEIIQNPVEGVLHV